MKTITIVKEDLPPIQVFIHRQVFLFNPFKMIPILYKVLAKAYKLGRYHYTFKADKWHGGRIEIHDYIYPVFGKRLIKHELEHHRIAVNAKSFVAAIAQNEEYDDRTIHGLLD